MSGTTYLVTALKTAGSQQMKSARILQTSQYTVLQHELSQSFNNSAVMCWQCYRNSH